MATELAVLGGLPGEFATVGPVVAGIAVLAAATLAIAETAAVRKAVLGAALAALLIAPATWSLQTPGHPTNGTFPAGGPPTAGFAGGPASPGGGMFGSDASLTETTAYAAGHGGGAIAVSSQSSAAAAILHSGADVIGLGGFSGRESEVTVAWFAERVEQGTIRWVLSGGDSGGMRDGRTGSGSVMNAVEQTCSPVAGVDGLYDCSSATAALAAAA
jgi:hypothetical protein